MVWYLLLALSTMLLTMFTIRYREDWEKYPCMYSMLVVALATNLTITVLGLIMELVY